MVRQLLMVSLCGRNFGVIFASTRRCSACSACSAWRFAHSCCSIWDGATPAQQASLLDFISGVLSLAASPCILTRASSAGACHSDGLSLDQREFRRLELGVNCAIKPKTMKRRSLGVSRTDMKRVVLGKLNCVRVHPAVVVQMSIITRPHQF